MARCSELANRRGIRHLTFELADIHLPKKSWVKISQIRTLSVERIGGKLGRATLEDLEKIIEALNEIVGE